jgi:hypothetical protein
MSGVGAQNESSTTNDKESAMSIVAPAIDVEIEYRRERIREDFRRSRAVPTSRPHRWGFAMNRIKRIVAATAVDQEGSAFGPSVITEGQASEQSTAGIR